MDRNEQKNNLEQLIGFSQNREDLQGVHRLKFSPLLLVAKGEEKDRAHDLLNLIIVGNENFPILKN
jgi:hypothetical protein